MAGDQASASPLDHHKEISEIDIPKTLQTDKRVRAEKYRQTLGYEKMKS